MDSQSSLNWAKKYIEDILSFFEINVEADVSINDGFMNISIPSNELNSLLIGRNAETLKSIQHLIVSGLHQNNSEIQRVNVDVAGYKQQHADKIAEKAKGWIERVIETKEDFVLNLNPADRRVVHQVASEYSEIETHSEGEGKERKLIISAK